MPTSIVLTDGILVNKICINNTPPIAYEVPSRNDLLESLSVIIKFILAEKRGKNKRFEEKMKKLSWGQIEEISGELGDKIKASGFQPDYIIGIAMGGLIPLYLVAKKLDIDKVLTVSASSYEKDKQKELKITYLPEVDLRGKKILLVDDIADTGVSLKGVSDAIISKYGLSELKTATLAVNKGRCKFYPDFYVAVEQSEWLVFPWEKEEFPEYFL